MQGNTEVTNSIPPISFFGESRRICSPAATIERVMKLAPVMGLTRLANITGLDTIGVPVYTAYRPNSRSLSVTQGKGVTHDAAKASALMEAVETYHAETIDLPLKLVSHIELSCKYKIADVSKLPKFSNSHFTPHARILWTEGHDLFSGEKKFVPYEMVHVDYRSPLPSGHGCFMPSSNGLASGNHILEATIHAACEIIERDSLTLWQLKEKEIQQLDRVDITSIDDPWCLEIIDRFQKADIEVGVWNITSDIGIPAFLCRIIPKKSSDISSMRPSSGMGCHLNSGIALSRALTEAAQSRLTFISGARDDLKREDYKVFLQAKTYNDWREALKCEASLVSFKDIISLETSGLKTDMDLILKKLKQRGIEEVIVVDLTKAEFGIPVIRMIIPGLESVLVKSETILGQRASRVIMKE